MENILDGFANVGERIGKKINWFIKKISNATAISAIVCVLGAIVFVSCLLKSALSDKK